jgi:hypothetical protein
MKVFSEGISKVRTFAIPAGVSSGGQANQLAGTAVVKWHSSYNNMLHQVYVNNRFAGVTVEPAQRQMIIPISLSLKTAVRIEVFAVEPGYADVDFSDEISSKQIQAGRVKIEFPRTDNLPVNGNIDYYLDGDRLNNRGIKIWPEFADKGGFGLSSFGMSDFGFDGSAAIGFGKGNFGFGWFGFDSDMLCWQSEQLEAGNYEFGIKITDNSGNETQEVVGTGQITIIPPAKPAESLKIESFDKQNRKLILKVG